MLSKIAEYHQDWIRFAKCFINSYEEDIVQEMYIRANDVDPKKYMVGEDINKNYFFTIIRNLCLDYHKVKGRVIKVEFIESLEDDFKTDGKDLREIEDHHQMHQEIRRKLLEEDRYLEMYYMIYTHAENPSYRDISEMTGIGLTAVHFDMQRVKETIKKNIKI